MADEVLYETDDGLAVITLNRPGQRNAVNTALGQALNEALVRAATDRSVRALIITGAGEGFCAGADFERLQEVTGGRDAQKVPATGPDPIFSVLPDAPPELRSRYTFAQAMPIPVIAAVNGVAVGAGLALALSADFRFAGPKAAFIGGFVRIGAIAEMGLAWTLTHLIGQGPARDMLLSGRRIEPEEALRLGLVSRVCAEGALMDECRAFARDLVQRSSPRSIRVIKKMLRAAPTQTFAEGFEMARVETGDAIASADFREGVAALRERRAPNFTGE